MKKAMICLKIRENLKQGLETLKKKDGASQTYHLEKALDRYFQSKKVVVNNESKKN